MRGEDAALGAFVAAVVVTAAAARWYVRRVRPRVAAGAAGRWPRLVAANALVLLFLLSVAALAGECWLRFAFDSTDQFGMLRTSDRWFERHYGKNNQSFRDDVDYVLGAVPEGRRRVTFVGDSFTAGHGVAEVADRFANRVRAARPRWEVHVLAHNGFDTGAEVELVDKLAPAYSKGRYAYDVVVLVYCLNDITDLMPDVAKIGRRLREGRERGVLARNSYLCDMLRFLSIVTSDAEVRGFFPCVADAYADAATWTAQRERLRAFSRAVTSRGGRPAVVTFPFLHSLGSAYPFRDAHTRLGEFWAAEGVAHLDLLPVFEGADDRDLVVGRFDAHPNERAHERAAAAILPFLDGVLAR